MLDIGWSEIAVIAVVALVVIGPKDLPYVLKTIGGWVRKARMLTREFQSHVDDMIREAELDEVRKKAVELRDMNLARQVENTIDPTGSLRNAFEIDPDKPAPPAASGVAAKAEAPVLPPGQEASLPPMPDPSPQPVPVPAGTRPASPETDKTA